MTQKKMSPLRARMIEDMRIRGLPQLHRPRPLACSCPEHCKDGAKRLFPGFKPDQSFGQNLESAAFTHNTIASVAVTEPASNALSP
ncbi:hypothetical protein G5B39_08290 [Rhodobacteraceae bacterium SC52]|nr:hypothetical protein G5B39_08290 [Rhodobacteraceae bacterium SC52]